MVVGTEIAHTCSLYQRSQNAVNVIWAVKYIIIYPNPVVDTLNKLFLLIVKIASIEEFEWGECSREWDSYAIVNKSCNNDGTIYRHFVLGIALITLITWIIFTQ